MHSWQKLFNRATAYHQAGKLNEALVGYRKVLRKYPRHADALHLLGIILADQSKVQEGLAYINQAIANQSIQLAIEAYQQALQLEPNNINVCHNLGNAYLAQKDYLNAANCYQTVLELKPDSAETTYFTALSLDQNNPEVYLNLGTNYRDQNRVGQALECFQKAAALKPSAEAEFNQAISLLLLGDFTNGWKKYEARMHISAGYLTAPNHLNGLINSKQLKVGIVWCGNKQNPNDRNRSIPLTMFEDLLSINKVKFYSLQWGESVQDIETYSLQNKLFNTEKYVKNLQDTASIVAQLDLLITVDTAIAHLAGALNKPTWILLPFAPDFRWLLNRDDSPWYKSVRLFRQEKAGEWGSVMQSVQAALQALYDKCLV